MSPHNQISLNRGPRSWLAALVTTLLLATALPGRSATAAPEISGYFKRFQDGSRTEPLFLNVKTSEGMHAFRFEHTARHGEETREEHFVGVSRRPSTSGSLHKASLSIFGTRGFLYFHSRRRGRPHAVEFTLERSTLAPQLTKVAITSIPKGFLSCAVEATESGAHALQSVQVAHHHKGPKQGVIPVRILEVAAEADYAFFRRFGSETRNYIRSSLRAADVLYTSELGIRIKLTSLRVNNRDSRKTSILSAEGLLESFRQQSTPRRVAADVHHLFTGSTLDGVTIGIAYVGTACLEQGRYNVGVSKAVNRALQPVLAAHEIAHNLSAVHDEGRSSVMNPAPRSSGASFSSKSRKDIRSFIELAGSCLSLPG